jgi:hypothetical protein
MERAPGPAPKLCGHTRLQGLVEKRPPLWYTIAAMGLASIVYIILVVVTAGGLIALIYSRIGNRPALRGKAFAVALLGAALLLFWWVFLGGLNDTLAEAIEDGRSAQNNVEQDRLAAKYRHEPPPKPNESDVNKLKAFEQAKRSARLFGWDWRKLEPSYRKARKPPPAPGPRRSPGRR